MRRVCCRVPVPTSAGMADPDADFSRGDAEVPGRGGGRRGRAQSVVRHSGASGVRSDAWSPAPDLASIVTRVGTRAARVRRNRKETMARPADHLVGRTDALASLDRVLTELDRGRAAAIEFVGEPGIGKTRLLEELAARADTSRRLVL